MSQDLELALELADLADPLALARFRGHDLVVETKADLTPVTEADLTLFFECDQRRPDGNPAGVVPRPVDRVDDPAPVPVRGPDAVLLSEHPVRRPVPREAPRDCLLDRAIRFRHGRQIGLRLDDEVVIAEPAERERVGKLGKLECELQIRAQLRSPQSSWR